ncbi:site-2 protease family protein [Natrialbaceae archaeon AArc-T1-2]|uniref:site-2 protease family protein n=1 Tax=Natrialbaceae archaeon AArc-T1-2 TaxID=3053904 RepID=UPI00255AD532|nr:site-2 protease family protein [Natrialbaceae archaeon AArc-T1-2]WIV66760.1 site-2 protease family protein [Natrialbaceae archaeon AArc-T1-2]
MFKSYRIGQAFGIPLKLDVTLLLVLPLFAWVIGAQIETVVPILNQVFGTDIAADALAGVVWPLIVGLLAAIGLFIGVALHEFGHALVALRYDYDIDSITLWLLGGVAQLVDRPRDWRHEFWIAIAGPIVSLAVGVVCYLALLVVPAGMDVTAFVLAYLALLNVGLAVFNMLPAFPLDGGRVLRAILARSMSYVRATKVVTLVGKGFAILLGLGGLATVNVFWVAIAIFVYIAATAESRQMMLDATLDGLTARDVMRRASELSTVPPELTVDRLLERMFQERQTYYPVVRDGQIGGVVTLEDVQELERTQRVAARVGDVMTSFDALERISADSDAMTAFQRLQQSESEHLLVVEDGSVVGVLTLEDLLSTQEIVREHRRVDDRSPRREPQRQRRL